MLAVTLPLALRESALDLSALLEVVADASPGLLPRLLEPFAKRDLIPDGVEARREGDAMRVTVRLDAVDGGELDRAIGNISQIVGVRSIRRAEAARQDLAA